MMGRCWTHEAENRPTMHALVLQLEKLRKKRKKKSKRKEVVEEDHEVIRILKRLLAEIKKRLMEEDEDELYEHASTVGAALKEAKGVSFVCIDSIKTSMPIPTKL